MIPAWHDKPTEPGLWVRVFDDGGVGGYLVDAEDIGDEFWANGCRFYGPIPPDNASGVGE